MNLRRIVPLAALCSLLVPLVVMAGPASAASTVSCAAAKCNDRGWCTWKAADGSIRWGTVVVDKDFPPSNLACRSASLKSVSSVPGTAGDAGSSPLATRAGGVAVTGEPIPGICGSRGCFTLPADSGAPRASVTVTGKATVGICLTSACSTVLATAGSATGSAEFTGNPIPDICDARGCFTASAAAGVTTATAGASSGPASVVIGGPAPQIARSAAAAMGGGGARARASKISVDDGSVSITRATAGTSKSGTASATAMSIHVDGTGVHIERSTATAGGATRRVVDVPRESNPATSSG